MGTLIILVAGLFGAVSANKKNFLQCWSFLFHFCFSLYIAIFLSPYLVSMLEIKKLDEVYKVEISLVVLFFLFMIILSKLSEQIFPNPEINLPIPAVMDKIGSLICGFLSGSLIVSLIIFLALLLPAAKKLPIPESVGASSSATLMRMIRTMNAFSFQSISEKGERALKTVRLIPDPEREAREKAAAEAAKASAENGVPTTDAVPDGKTPETTPAVPAENGVPTTDAVPDGKTPETTPAVPAENGAPTTDAAPDGKTPETTPAVPAENGAPAASPENASSDTAGQNAGSDAPPENTEENVAPDRGESEHGGTKDQTAVGKNPGQKTEKTPSSKKPRRRTRPRKK